MPDMPGMKMNGMMAGQAGFYSMMRDASGTSWQPDSTPMEGLMGEWAGWSTMLHGYVTGVYDHQAGPRGDDKSFSESMFMAMGQKQLGIGTLTLRSMLSLDPLMGKSGYPLLLQTGETANGITPLVDRQHPHDLFMELAGIYSVPVGADMSVFGYVGYPGEPALGPPTFMHRFSGMDDPAAPIGHHWLDSTHITYGVLTAGFVDGDWKIEGSAFRGREPDQFRWNFDPVSLDFGIGAAELESHPGLGAPGQLRLHQESGAARARCRSASPDRIGQLQCPARSRQLADHSRLGPQQQPAGPCAGCVPAGIGGQLVPAHAVLSRRKCRQGRTVPAAKPAGRTGVPGCRIFAGLYL